MATLSGQKAVTTAGTAVQLHSGLVVNGPVMVKALPANTGIMYVGNVAEDVASNNGMPLSLSDSLIFNFVGNLNQIWVDASVNGEGVAWLALTF
jgi:hypothetical protein